MLTRRISKNLLGEQSLVGIQPIYCFWFVWLAIFGWFVCSQHIVDVTSDFRNEAVANVLVIFLSGFVLHQNLEFVVLIKVANPLLEVERFGVAEGVRIRKTCFHFSVLSRVRIRN